MNAQLKWYSFRWRTLVVILVLCTAVWYYMQGRFLHPVGSGPAGPAVASEPFQHVWSEEETVLVGLGDSITAGYGASAGCGYFDLLVRNDDAGYPDMKGRDLGSVFPRLTFVNDSQSFTISQEHLTDQVPYIKKYPQNVKGIVVITSGGNDVIHDYGKSEPVDGAMYGGAAGQALEWSVGFKQRLRGIVEGVNEKFPGGCEIFMANIYDPTDGVGDIQNAHLLLPPWPDGVKVLEIWNRTIAEVCDEYPNVHLVDIHSHFLGHGIHCRNKRNPHYRPDDPHYWYYSNLEDPNDRGYDAIRRIFLLQMARVLKNRY